MSRLEDALLAHEATLRKELAAAERERNELRLKLRTNYETVRMSRADIAEVEDELARRGIVKDAAFPPKDFLILEEP